MKNRLFTTLLVFLCCVCNLAAQEAIRILHGPYLQNLKDTEVTLVWTVNKPSVAWAELAPEDGSSFYRTERVKVFDATHGVKNVSQVHAVRITGLKPGTSYRYRIFAQEVLSREGENVYYGNVAATSIYDGRGLKFTTNDATKPTTSFVMLNDIHGNSDYIPQLLKVADYESTDMVIYNGDMVSLLMDEEELFKGFMDVSVETFAAHKPMYYARGNHETRGLKASSFHTYFSPKEPNLYFTLRQGPVYFVFLDTGEDKPDSDIEYHGITDYDNYRTEQARWLEQVVRSDEFRQAPFKVVVAHMPPVPEEDMWHGQAEVMEKFVPILNKAGSDLMLCGHLHSYLHTEPSAKIAFPVVVNSSNTVLKGVVEDNHLKLGVIRMNGELVDTLTFGK